MPYQPISPYPYLKTIDSTIDNTFSCVINPRDIIVKYVLNIINIDSTTGEAVLTITEDKDGLVYSGISSEIDGEIITKNLQLPVYGDSKKDAILKIPIPAHYILDKTEEDSNTENDEKKNGDYVWNITLYDNKNNSTTSCDYYFKVRDTATVILSNGNTVLSNSVPNTIDSGNICINATYSQPQNILPAYYCFNIYLDNKIVYTTGNVVSSNITLEYDSLISGNTYKLELLICDDDKTQSRFVYDLNVSYDYFSAPINPVVDINNDKTFSTVDYSYNISIIGKYDKNKDNLIYKKYIEANTGSVPEDTISNGVCIPKEQVLYWNERTVDVPLDLDNTCQLINWHGHKGYSGVILEKLDEGHLLDKIVVGHDVPNSLLHPSNDLIYISTSDPFMPMGVLTDGIQGGFYYKFGNLPTVYISEFTKVSSAIYQSDAETDESIATSQIDDDTLYVLNDDDVLSDDNILLSNDTTNNYWWVIGVLNDSAVVYRNEKYNETVVSE